MNFLIDEEAQTTVEYMLLLSVVVFIFLMVYKGLIKPLFAELAKMGERVFSDVFKGERLHYYPLGK